jgi:Rrf2 family transcriptional regulator, iron-sulfur cluster assembly transcription factor
VQTDEVTGTECRGFCAQFKGLRNALRAAGALAVGSVFKWLNVGSKSMELTTKGRYAVMALTDLAANSADGSHSRRRSVPIADIATRQNLSQSYLEQLFARLRRAGLVNAIRGPGGGYRLAREADAISVSAIVAAVDEEIRVTACSKASELGCQGRTTRCNTHDLWAELTVHIDQFLTTITLADIVSGRIRGRAAAMAAGPVAVSSSTGRCVTAGRLKAGVSESVAA